MTRKRSALDHLKSGREPHIVTMIPPGAPGFKEAQGGAMVISSPAEVDRMLKDIRRGEVITLTDLRAAIAKKHNVAVACPVSTAIFANMVARAAEEMRAVGSETHPVVALAAARRVLKPQTTWRRGAPSGAARARRRRRYPCAQAARRDGLPSARSQSATPHLIGRSTQQHFQAFSKR
jgi:hypothetical protein